MRSSGQLATERTEFRECDGTITHNFPLFGNGPTFEQSWPCTFEGEVDVFIDPETYSAAWECPRCETEHDVSGEVFL